MISTKVPIASYRISFTLPELLGDEPRLWNYAIITLIIMCSDGNSNNTGISKGISQAIFLYSTCILLPPCCPFYGMYV